MQWSVKRFRWMSLALCFSVGVIVSWSNEISAQGVKPTSPRTKPWALEGAMEHLQMYPNDAYLQYVAMQLANRQGLEMEISRKIAAITNAGRPEWRRRQDGVNLFSLFSGTLAIQESLQLEAMAGAPVNSRQPRDTGVQLPKLKNKPDVAVNSLRGPTTKSHPWKEMLGDKKRQMSAMASYVPEDQYYIRFQSVAKLMDVLQLSDDWGEHLISQSNRKAYSTQVNDRIMTQLAVETSDLMKPFYDLVVQEVVATGSDLYLTRGSDIALLFRFKQPVVFKAQMEVFLKNSEKAHADAFRGKGKYNGVEYASLITPNRLVHVFTAYLGDDVHVRSNTLIGLQRVIDTIQDEGDDGGKIRSLAESDEFAYIRTLMPPEAKEEDGFIYLSDPLIRRLTGPELKLTERRRVLCYNHLRMISHACAMYETEQGKSPKTIDDLFVKECVPSRFNDQKLSCPCGGTYTLSDDGKTGVCSHHGRIGALVPCCEIIEETVTAEEAELYKGFVTSYEQYWQTFFDPIAIRLAVQPDEFRMETIILPLINNSIYQGMASTLGGTPTPLDQNPIPDRNIFSMAFQIDKDRLLEESGWKPVKPQLAGNAPLKLQFEASTQRLRKITIAMHNYHDAKSTFPAVASYDKEGRQLLSWRVHLLPYLGQNELYKRFHLDEPWSSDHNRKLIGSIPSVYSIPGEKKEEGRTAYQVIVGENTLFNGTNKALRMRDVTDGTSNTILVVESKTDQAVIWTRPNDIKFDMQQLRKNLIGRYGDDSFVGMADGAVRRVKKDIDATTLQNAITRNDGQPIRNFGAPVRSQRRNRNSFGRWLTNLDAGDIDEHLAYEFITRGIKDQLAMHVYDSEPTFDFQLTRFLGQSLGSFSTRNRLDGDFGLVFLMIASLNSPVYVSVPLDDVEVTDRFLEHLDEQLAPIARKTHRTGFFNLENDFYTIPINDEVTARTASIGFGPIKWRFFWARIGKQLYISSKPEVLQDLAKMQGEDLNDSPDPASAAHAMIRIRPENWNQTLSNFQLGWAESHRLACLDNVGRLSSLQQLATDNVEDRPEQLYGVNFSCPCGGKYHVDGKHGVVCSVHGNAYTPRQSALGKEQGSIRKVLSNFGGLTIALTFLEDGLHATMTVKRKK